MFFFKLVVKNKIERENLILYFRSKHYYQIKKIYKCEKKINSNIYFLEGEIDQQKLNEIDKKEFEIKKIKEINLNKKINLIYDYVNSSDQKESGNQLCENNLVKLRERRKDSIERLKITLPIDLPLPKFALSILNIPFSLLTQLSANISRQPNNNRPASEITIPKQPIDYSKYNIKKSQQSPITTNIAINQQPINQSLFTNSSDNHQQQQSNNPIPVLSALPNKLTSAATNANQNVSSTTQRLLNFLKPLRYRNKANCITVSSLSRSISNQQQQTSVIPLVQLPSQSPSKQSQRTHSPSQPIRAHNVGFGLQRLKRFKLNLNKQKQQQQQQQPLFSVSILRFFLF